HRRRDLPAAEEGVGNPAAAHFEGASFAERQVVSAGHLDDIGVVEAIRTALRNPQVLVHPAPLLNLARPRVAGGKHQTTDETLVEVDLQAVVPDVPQVNARLRDIHELRVRAVHVERADAGGGEEVGALQGGDANERVAHQ